MNKLIWVKITKPEDVPANERLLFCFRTHNDHHDNYSMVHTSWRVMTPFGKEMATHWARVSPPEANGNPE